MSGAAVRAAHLERFVSYASGFRGDGETDKGNFALKLRHSLEVHDLADRIASAENLGDDLGLLVRLSALYHDVGRFEQYARHKTFRDGESLDHGLLGARVLRREGLLDDLEPGLATAVRAVTATHNRLALPRRMPARIARAAAIVRECDKLDIMRVMLDCFENPDVPSDAACLHLDRDESAVTPSVLNAALQGADIRYTDLVYVNDFKILIAGWVMTLATREAYVIAVRRGYLERLFGSLPDEARLATLRRCLERDLVARWGAAGDASADLAI